MRIRQHIGNVDINIDTKRIDRNMMEAQKLLNLQVQADCEPFVPFQQGYLLESAHFPEGVYGGVLQYDGPYAHYLYQGIKYGPNIPIKDSQGNITGWYSPPSKHPTGEKLKYHPEGTERGDHWFEKAKEQHKQDWIDLVKRTAGKE